MNDSDEDLKSIRLLADSLRNRPGIHIEPFHPFGRNKSVQLGLDPEENVLIPNEKDIQRWHKQLL